MISIILTHINSNIEALNLFRLLHSLCELQTKDKQTFPCEYLSNGEFKQLSLDNVQSEIYHRHDGAVTRDNKIKNIVACDNAVMKTYPMALIGFMERKVTGKDNAFIPDNVCEVVSNAMDEKTAKALTALLGAQTTSVNVKSYSTDTDAIFNREFKGNEREKLNLNYFMFEIKYEVTVTAAESCFQNWCEIDC